jgi:hypothetical protein
VSAPDLWNLSGLALRVALLALARALGVPGAAGLRVVPGAWARVGASCVVTGGAAIYVHRWTDAGPLVFAETADGVLALWTSKQRSADAGPMP